MITILQEHASSFIKSDNEIMHMFKTLHLDMSGKIAQEMQNRRLFSKLSEGDMAATEPKTIDLL